MHSLYKLLFIFLYILLKYIRQVCSFSIVIVTCMHMTIVYLSNYTLYYKPHTCHFRTPKINISGYSSIVICEKDSKV